MAAITSCYSEMMMLVGPLRDTLRWSLRKAVTVSILVVTVVGIPSALSFSSVGAELFGEPFLDILDRMVGSGVILVFGTAGATLFAWRLPTAQLVQAFNWTPLRVGPVTLSSGGIVTVGRLIPVAAVAALTVTALI